MYCLASRNLRNGGWMCREGDERSSTADPGRGREGPHALVPDRFTRERMALSDILPDGVYESGALARGLRIMTDGMLLPTLAINN
jgi:hypothetical protein